MESASLLHPESVASGQTQLTMRATDTQTQTAVSGDRQVPGGARTLVRKIAAIPSIDRESIPTSARSLVMSCVTAAIGAYIIWSVYATGISRGMDHVVAYGVEIDTTPMTVALTESAYGLDLGYLGLSSVFQTLFSVISRDSTRPFDAAIQRNIRDRQLINEAITRARSLTPREAAVGYISDGRLITTMYQDLGSVDYMKLAFRLFGYRIEALYYTFFVTIVASALLYLITFPNSLAAQLILLCTLFAFELELRTPLFDPSMPTFAGVRHSSVLCLIPFWYFSLLIVQRRKLSWFLLLVAAGQLAILVLALTARGTAVWAVIFIAVLATACATYRCLTVRSDRAWTPWLRHIASWPVVLVIAAYALHVQYMNLKLHPVYFTDDILPHHPVWNSAYVGLLYSPELYGFPVRPEQLGSDALPIDGAMDYLRSIHFVGNETNLSPYEALKAAEYFTPWSGGNPKYALHDEVMRRVVLQIARKHPFKMIYLLAWKKPVAIWIVCNDLLRRSEDTMKWLMLAGGLVAALLGIVFGNRRELVETARLIPVASGAAMTALLPAVWAYPVPWSVSDGLLLMFGMAVLIVGICAWAFCAIVRQAISTVRNIDRRRAAAGTSTSPRLTD